MARPLSFDHLQALLRQYTAGLPDVRKPSPNTRYTIQNAALGVFGIFFMQSPSFLEYQRQLHQRQGHDNAQLLFGVEPIPCDNQIRKLLDPIAPRYFTSAGYPFSPGHYVTSITYREGLMALPGP